MKSTRTDQIFAASLWLLGLITPLAGQAGTAVRTTSFDYFPDGSLSKIIVAPDDTPICLVSELTYDAYGNISSQTKRNCAGIVGSRPGLNDEAATPGANARFDTQSETYFWTNPRFKDTTTNALEQLSSSAYDSLFGIQTRETAVNGTAVQQRLDSWGRPVLQQYPDGNGIEIVYRYCDSNFPCPAVAIPDMGTIAPAFWIIRTPRTEINISTGTFGAQNGPQVYEYYDRRRTLLRVRTQGFDAGANSGLDVYTEHFTSSQPVGQYSIATQPHFEGASVRHSKSLLDARGRVTYIGAPNGTVTQYKYSNLQTTETVTPSDPQSQPRVSVVNYNYDGSVSTVKDALNITSLIEYNGAGSISAIIDPLGNKVKYEYNDRDQITKRSDGDRGSSTYQYDAAGRLKKRVDNGNGPLATTYEYDKLNRQITRVGPDYGLKWYFDTNKDTSVDCP